jgi:hypothetical protein
MMFHGDHAAIMVVFSIFVMFSLVYVGARAFLFWLERRRGHGKCHRGFFHQHKTDCWIALYFCHATNDVDVKEDSLCLRFFPFCRRFQEWILTLFLKLYCSLRFMLSCIQEGSQMTSSKKTRAVPDLDSRLLLSSFLLILLAFLFPNTPLSRIPASTAAFTSCNRCRLHRQERFLVLQQQPHHQQQDHHRGLHTGDGSAVAPAILEALIKAISGSKTPQGIFLEMSLAVQKNLDTEQGKLERIGGKKTWMGCLSCTVFELAHGGMFGVGRALP